MGAQPRAIFLQFFAESCLLALTGWATGCVLGSIGVATVACGTGWTLDVSLNATATTLALALAIGIGFGAIPAGRATRIPPVQALTQR